MKTLREPPKLIINPLVYEKMNQLVKQSSNEISWHGFVKREENIFIWYDIILYPQYNTGATSTSDEDEYADWLVRQFGFDNFMDLRLHGHSHVNMTVSPSGTDLDFRKNLTKNLKKDDFYIFLIINKKGDYNLEIIDYKDMIVYDTKDITVQTIEPKIMEKASDWATKVISDNVKEKKCSTIINPKNSSIRNYSKNPSISSDVEPLEQPWLKTWLEQDYPI